MKKVGMPRGLYYYDYYLLWEAYFNSLNMEVVSSIKTNKDILDLGIASCVDEACLPVKIYHGHVAYLKDKVDCIFIPKYIRLYKKEYNCPKHLGIVDMLNSSIENLPPLITPKIELNNKADFKNIMYSVGREFKKSNKEIKNAYKYARKTFSKQDDWIQKMVIPDYNKKELKKGRIKLLILGHSYNVYDDFLNMGLIKKLYNKGVDIATVNDINENEYRLYSYNKNKRIFWTQGRKIIGTAYSLIEGHKVDGIIYISAFGCGLDSVLIYPIEKKSHDYNIPFMTITFDEHTGEAGIDTRIEAFLDMMKWRSESENYLPSFR